MTINPVIWFEIYVQELERARCFYETVFQFKLTKLETPAGIPAELWAFPMEQSVVGAGGALVKMEGMTPSAGGTIVYFASNDCAIEEARVVQAGGRIHRGKFSIGQFGNIALAFDTEGNMFGVHSMD